MIISWLGDAGIRIQTKETVVIIDPPGTDAGFKPTKQAATVVALSQAVGTDAKSVTGEPLLITSPGEYERQGIFIYGIQLPADSTRVHFRVEAEELSLGHLGGLKEKLDNGQLASFEGVDVLFVPVGGKSVYTADEASTLISQIEPRIVIPIQHKSTGSTAGFSDVAAFLKEMGSKDSEVVDKLKIVKKDLPADETRVIILSAT